MKVKLILITCSLLFFSCQRSKEKTDDLVFRYNESKGISSLDPAYARSLPLIWPVNQLFNGLVQLTDSLTVVPSIAKSWEVTPDGKIYTFTLRSNVFFHDSPAFADSIGRKVVASDFIYSFGRILDPAVASPGSWIFNFLDTRKPNAIIGCEAPNDTTLRIHLKKSFPAFLGILSMPYAFVVPREAVEYYGKDFRSNPVGTGPFYIKYWKEGEKLVFRRNPRYFESDENGQQLPHLESVSISFIADKQSEFLEFLKGNIDFISGVYAATKDELLTRSGKLNPRYRNRIQMISGPYLNTEYLGILVDTTLESTKFSPLSNPLVRKAIGYSIDRGKMMTYLRSNVGFPAHAGFVPPGMPGFYENKGGFSYDPELAQKLLSDAGYPNGTGMQPITICTTDDYLDICEFVQHQLGKLGIPVRVEVFPGAAYREMIANSKMQIFRASWVADYADAENYLSLFFSPNFSPNGPNYTHFFNQEFDSLYNLTYSQVVAEERFSTYRKMDSLLMSDAPVIPLYYDKVIRFTQVGISGLGSNPMNLLIIKNVKKVKGYN